MAAEAEDRPEPRLLESIPATSRAQAIFAAALRTLRDAATEPEEKALYDDILAGRRSARALADSPLFARRADEGVRQYQEKLDAMDPASRGEFDRAAAQLAETFRDAPQ